MAIIIQNGAEKEDTNPEFFFPSVKAQIVQLAHATLHNIHAD